MTKSEKILFSMIEGHIEQRKRLLERHPTDLPLSEIEPRVAELNEFSDFLRDLKSILS